MTDRYDQDKVLGYIEGTLSDAERASFEAELAQDDALRELVEGILEDMSLMGDLPVEKPEIDLVEEVMQQQERNMLLGEPDQPLSIDGDDRGVAGRIRFARVIGYSAIAAIFILCGGVIVSTLFHFGPLSEMANELSGKSKLQRTPLAMVETQEESLSLKQSGMADLEKGMNFAAGMQSDVMPEAAAGKMAVEPSKALSSRIVADSKRMAAEKEARTIAVERDYYAKENLRLKEQVLALKKEQAIAEVEQPMMMMGGMPAPEMDINDALSNTRIASVSKPRPYFERTQTDLSVEGKSVAGREAVIPTSEAKKVNEAVNGQDLRPLVLMPTEHVVALNVDTDSMYATEQQVLRWASANEVEVFKTDAIATKQNVRSGDAVAVRRSSSMMDAARTGDTLRSRALARDTKPSTKTSLADRVRKYAKNDEPASKVSAGNMAVEPEKEAENVKDFAYFGMAKTDTAIANQKEMVVEIKPDQMGELLRTLKVRSNQKIDVVSKPLDKQDTETLSQQIQTQLPLNFIWVEQPKANEFQSENWGQMMFRNMPLSPSRPILRIKHTGMIHLPIVIQEETASPKNDKP